MDHAGPLSPLNESTEAQLDRCMEHARTYEAFMAGFVQDLLGAPSAGDRRHDASETLHSDPPIVYNDEIAAEISVARTSPDRPQDMVRVKARGSAVDLITYGQWLANILASGVLGNAAWDAIKAAAISYRRRQIAGAPPEPLSLDEARVVAYYAAHLNSTLHACGAKLSEPVVELRSSITEHRWEFVFERWGRWWYIGVPHRDPTMAAITALEMFPDTAERVPNRHISPTRTTYLGRLLRKLLP
ncbi:hypothetical protein [Actinoplanes teichomyceticus]|uniref:hypothetical protein n=1 Tax=Actinoplanes teichomyceticus TaxID=1867 RepID=UPI0011A29935|nr:hypothetical protein [Actinoplanes teichomyceticus]GIF14210.1 hypothetical protein Ate01nite_42420 [Actinoplanes teichomyceticus]